MLTFISMTGSGFPPVLGMHGCFPLTMLGAGSKSWGRTNAPTFVRHLRIQLPIPALTEAKEPAPKVGAIDVMGLDLAL